MTIQYRADQGPPLTAAQHDANLAYLYALTTIRDGGAVGDGAEDDTADLESVLAAGGSISLNAAKTYRISRALALTLSGQGIEGNGATIIISTDPGDIDNSVYANRYATNARAVICAGASNSARIEKPFLRNIVFRTSAWVDDRYVGAVRFYFVDNFEIDNCEFSGFSRGAMISLNNVDGGKILKSRCLDSWSNSTTANMQLTGISSDEDANVITDQDGRTYSSRDVLIDGCTFSNLTMGNTARAALGYQTDAITLGGPSTLSNPKPTRNFRITNCHFYNLGEGVDCWGVGNIVNGCTFWRMANCAVKLIYGASRNIVSSCTIEDSGLAGIVLDGQTTQHANVDANQILNCTIRGVAIAGDWQNADGGLSYDYAAAGSVAWGFASSNAGIRINCPASPVSLVTNTIIDNCTIDLTSTGKFGIYAENTSGASSTNIVRNCKISNFTIVDYQDSLGLLQHENQPVHRLRQSANYTLTSTTSAQKLFNASTNGAFTGKAGRRYRFRMWVQMDSLSSSSGNFSFGFGGTATFTAINFWTIGQKNGGAGAPTFCNFATAGPSAIVSANTSTAGQIWAEGEIIVNAAGTIIPQISLGVAAAGRVLVGSFVEFAEDRNIAVAVGDWT